jgi:ssDNA-binding replication factor A large subunit
MPVSEGDVLDEVLGTIIKIGEPYSGKSKATKRNFTVTSATFRSPETGDIGLALWGMNNEKYRVGDKVIVKKATVTKFRDQLQLSVAKKSEGGSISLVQ